MQLTCELTDAWVEHEHQLKSYMKPAQESGGGVPVMSGDVSVGQVTVSVAASKVAAMATALALSLVPVPSTSGAMPELQPAVCKSHENVIVAPVIDPVPEEAGDVGDVEMDVGDNSGEHLEVCKEGAMYS